MKTLALWMAAISLIAVLSACSNDTPRPPLAPLCELTAEQRLHVEQTWLECIGKMPVNDSFSSVSEYDREQWSKECLHRARSFLCPTGTRVP